MPEASTPPRGQLEGLLNEALRAVHGGNAVARSVRRHGDGSLEIANRKLAPETPLRVVAAGKAACAMAAAFEAQVGPAIRHGLVVTKDGHAQPVDRFEVVEAGHPVPDERSERAAHAVLALAGACEPDESFVLLLSGGASALLTAPLPGLSRADLAATTEHLLECGADIHELNTVRKHLAAVGGGRLALGCSASQVLVLAVSDVPGDDLAVIGSGPCELDPTSYADALSVVARHRLEASLPPAALAHLRAGAAGASPESAKGGEAGWPAVHSAIVARSRDAVEAALAEARRRGLRAVDLGDVLHGEARDRGRELAALALASDPDRPCVLIGAGETTVTLRGRGRGGRNQELALAAAIGLQGRPGRVLLAAGTDGTDGPTDAAGAFVEADTVARGHSHGVDAARSLARNDSHGFFSRAGGLLRTGPTATNVMDLVLIGIGLENASNSDRDDGV